MYMKDWIERLDDFLKITGNDILQHSGAISHEQAITKATEEYKRFKELHKNELSEAEKHFIGYIERAAKKLEPKKKKDD